MQDRGHKIRAVDDQLVDQVNRHGEFVALQAYAG